MPNRNAGADTQTFKMRPQPGDSPGMARDGHGDAIPLDERTEDDRRTANAAGETGSVKNPDQEARHPAAMPRDQQGQGGSKRDRDPAGQQGGHPQR
jgi:hypothetical protein